MAIEILDHGACKAAGTYELDPDDGSPILEAQGILSAAAASVDNYLANLTLQEEIAYDELIGFIVNSTIEQGAPSLHWLDESTVQVDINPSGGEPVGPAVDFVLFKIQGMGDIPYTPYVVPPPD